MENRHPLRGHRRLRLEHPNSTFEADGDDRRPGQAAAHISAQEEDDHQMTHPGTSSTRRQNRIGSEVVRRSSDERLNCFFYVIFYIILDQRHLIFCLLWICACCTTKCMAGVQGRVSQWHELRSSSTAPFFGRSAGWFGGEAFGRCKEQCSTMRECCSMCLSNYGSRTHRRYVMALPPDPKKAINTRVPLDSGRFSRSGVHRIGNPGIVFRPQTQPRVVPRPWDPSRCLDDLHN